MWFWFSNHHFQNDFDFKSPLYGWFDFDFKIINIWWFCSSLTIYQDPVDKMQQNCRVVQPVFAGLVLTLHISEGDTIPILDSSQVFKGLHLWQRFSIATAMCSQIAVAVDGLPTHAATDLFNLSQLNRSSLIVTMSDLPSDDQIAHRISENSDQPQQRPASCGGGCGCWSPYTGNLVEVAVGNCGCYRRSLSWMGPFRPAASQ